MVNITVFVQKRTPQGSLKLEEEQDKSDSGRLQLFIVSLVYLGYKSRERIPWICIKCFPCVQLNVKPRFSNIWYTTLKERDRRKCLLFLGQRCNQTQGPGKRRAPHHNHQTVTALTPVTGILLLRTAPSHHRGEALIGNSQGSPWRYKSHLATGRQSP